MQLPLRVIITIFTCVFCSYSLDAKGYYDYNANCREAYGYFLSLQPAQGQALLKKDATAHPENLMGVYLADYDDCLLLLFNGDETDYERLKGNMSKRLGQLDKGDDKSPWHRLCRSGVYLHWAFVSIRFGDNLKAAGLFRKSFALIKENRRRFPDFEYNDVFYGLEEAALGAIPNDYKWIASIFGLKGDIKKGAHRLTSFLKKHNESDMLYKEAYIYTTYLRFYLLSDKVGVWDDLLKLDCDQDLMMSFLKANIAINNRHSDVAIRVLDSAKKLPLYNKYPIMNYEMGQALYHKLDRRCVSAFDAFLNKYKGGLFVKDVYKKLSLVYYLNGDQQKAQIAKAYINNVGSTVVDADKQAVRFASKKEWPNKELLKASLLVDGGYYNDALAVLQKYNETLFSNTADKLEFLFWMGRANDELGKDQLAIKYYQSTIVLGKDRKEHFAARSALQIGFIYEEQGKKASAILMYKRVLGMDDHDYKNSIDQQAKAGINRLTVN